MDKKELREQRQAEIARSLGISKEEFEYNLNQDKTIIKKLYHNYCEYFNQSNNKETANQLSRKPSSILSSAKKPAEDNTALRANTSLSRCNTTAIEAYVATGTHLKTPNPVSSGQINSKPSSNSI
jgi:hypothetical protein